MNDKNSLKLPDISLRPINHHIIKKPRNIYFLNSLKYLKIKMENSKNIMTSQNKNDKNIKNLKYESISILNLPKNKTIESKNHIRNKRNLKIIPNFSFKNIFESIKKNNLKKCSSYNNINTKERDKLYFESNFMKLRKESNIYTSDANYINNSKMLLMDKYNYDNNKYKPNRLHLFDISDFRKIKFHNKQINGVIYFNHNKYKKIIERNVKY